MACRCMTPPLDFRDYDKTFVGVDETHGRYGDVTIERCKHCGALWLHYLVEYESHSRSGRWYRGIVTTEVAKTVRPEAAVAVLQSLPWRLAGGSYFESRGHRH